MHEYFGTDLYEFEPQFFDGGRRFFVEMSFGDGPIYVVKKVMRCEQRANVTGHRP